MTKLIYAAACALALQGIASANAQTYPSRPITLIVPLAPGGSTDVIARVMAEGMRAALGQPVIVEHVASVDDRRHETTFLHKYCQKTLAFRPSTATCGDNG